MFQFWFKDMTEHVGQVEWQGVDVDKSGQRKIQKQLEKRNESGTPARWGWYLNPSVLNPGCTLESPGGLENYWCQHVMPREVQSSLTWDGDCIGVCKASLMIPTSSQFWKPQSTHFMGYGRLVINTVLWHNKLSHSHNPSETFGMYHSYF